MKKIMIYEDEGVSASSLQRLFSVCLELLPQYAIQLVNHRIFLVHGWEAHTALLIFPGGRDLAYHHKLKGAANARIRSFVYLGGRFLGICAGGYYGATEIEFEKGGELEICGQRELCFFPGRAVGPAYGPGLFRYEDETGARSALIHWEKGCSFVYFNGGCYFEDADKHTSTQILAHYSDLPGRPAACVYCQYGQGAALLSGIHPEYAPKEPFLAYMLNKILT
jgi:biotin--protein ligase